MCARSKETQRVRPSDPPEKIARILMQCGTDAAAGAYSWQNNRARRERDSNDVDEGTGFGTGQNTALSPLRSQQDDWQRSLPQLPREAAGKYAAGAGADPV